MDCRDGSVAEGIDSISSLVIGQSDIVIAELKLGNGRLRLENVESSAEKFSAVHRFTESVRIDKV